jgi:hypothetical protein
MSVLNDVSRAHVEDELKEAEPWGLLHGWNHSWEPEGLLLRTEMLSKVDRQKFVIEFTFANYREFPPYIEFLHPDTNERGTHRCYPKGGRGYFHGNPVICAPWNRKAYAAHGGPHSDWVMSQWAAYRANHSKLGDILALLQELLDDRAGYGGRMAP